MNILVLNVTIVPDVKTKCAHIVVCKIFSLLLLLLLYFTFLQIKMKDFLYNISTSILLQDSYKKQNDSDMAKQNPVALLYLKPF